MQHSGREAALEKQAANRGPKLLEPGSSTLSRAEWDGLFLWTDASKEEWSRERR